jgi:subtilase family serine protease
VIAVGGTTLTTDAAGDYLGEAGWSGSSGSVSKYESQPSYQTGVVTQSTTGRAAPDVSMDADPNSGVAVYDSFDGVGTAGNWFQVGGTSLSTPMWGGIIAIVNQGRVANQLPTYDGATNTLPQLYKLPQTDFNDITTGSDTNHAAGAGYDLVTGRGTPIANKLVPDLANLSGGTTPINPNPPPTNQPPVIGSLTSSASPAIANQVFTVTANNVTVATGTIASVSFYEETNGTSGLQTTGSNPDVLLGTVTSAPWSINLVGRRGSYTLYAQATGSDGLVSQAATLNLSIVKASAALAFQDMSMPAADNAFGDSASDNSYGSDSQDWQTDFAWW